MFDACLTLGLALPRVSQVIPFFTKYAGQTGVQSIHISSNDPVGDHFLIAVFSFEPLTRASTSQWLAKSRRKPSSGLKTI